MEVSKKKINFDNILFYLLMGLIGISAAMGAGYFIYSLLK